MKIEKWSMKFPKIECRVHINTNWTEQSSKCRTEWKLPCSQNLSLSGLFLWRIPPSHKKPLLSCTYLASRKETKRCILYVFASQPPAQKPNKIETCAVRKACVINRPRESVNLCAMNITCKILKYKKQAKKNKVQHLCCTATPLSVALRQQRDGIKKQNLDFRKWVRILCKSKWASWMHSRLKFFHPLDYCPPTQTANCSNEKGPNPFVSRIIFSVFI